MKLFLSIIMLLPTVAFAGLTGTWKGAGELLTDKGAKAACSSVEVKVDQKTDSLKLDGLANCGSTLDLSQDFKIVDEDLFLGSEMVGSIHDNTMFLRIEDPSDAKKKIKVWVAQVGNDMMFKVRVLRAESAKGDNITITGKLAKK